MTARAGVAAVVVVLLALAGCSGGEEDSTSTPAQALASAKRQLDQTPGVHLALSADRLPTGVNGLLGADGVATHAPAFQGQIRVAASGITANAAVVAVDGLVYAKLPFTTEFVTIDPADYGAPDPAALMDTEHGLSSLLTAARDVTEGERKRSGDQVLRTYRGTLPGRAVAAVIPSASATGSFDVAFRLTEGRRLEEAVLTGPFYPGADAVTYTVDLDRYGSSPEITAP